VQELRSLHAPRSDARHLRTLVASFVALQDRAYLLYVGHRDPSPELFAPDNLSPRKVIARVDRAAKALPARACVQGKAMRRALTLPPLPKGLFSW
jgi:hypothetical protein